VATENGIGFDVAFSVPPDLLTPVFSVRARQWPMFWASMPETSVNEYRDPSPREKDVSTRS
jgi:hypothetical protein